MPFRAAAGMAKTVVLARCSAPERVHLIADSGVLGGIHSTGCLVRFSMSCCRGSRTPCLLLLLRPCNNTLGAGA